jgi:tetrahydromethanopterin S-methyltransferase subunit G
MIVVSTLVFELLITKLAGVNVGLLWGITIGIYLLFLLYQLLVKVNEDSEKRIVRELLFEIMDTINGVPVINKNERLIIKWDLVFKKLLDAKELMLYDKIIHTKTTHIDEYVNRYPSLLIDDSVDLKKSKINGDLSSTIRSKNSKGIKKELENLEDENCKRRLFVIDIKDDTLAFSSYDSSLYVDVMLRNEYIPENLNEVNEERNFEYDGFSVWMTFANKKYNVVPRIIVHKKLINKSKWLIDNIEELLKCATGIVNGNYENILHVDEYKLVGYLIDMPDPNNGNSILEFKQLVNDKLVFVGVDANNRTTTAYCKYKSGSNRFEVVLDSVEFKSKEGVQHIEVDKTVAIGNGYQPLVTLLEKMPELIRNIDLVINNKDIISIVIS